MAQYCTGIRFLMIWTCTIMTLMLLPAEITAAQIKQACQGFTRVTDKEVYRLCKQYSRKIVHKSLKIRGWFILPKRNGSYLYR